MRQLLPKPIRDADPDLESLYAYPGGAGRWVRATMVSSADGAAAADGGSAALSGPGDKRIFRLLRGLADVVLVGGGTVRAEGYAKPVTVREQFAEARARAGQTPAAAVAVVSASLDLDFDSALYRAPAAPTITVTTEDAPADRLAAAHAAGEVIQAGRGRVDLAAAIDALAAVGLGRILCEGGPRLLAEVAASGRLDELCLSVSPRLIGGDGPRVLGGPPFDPPVPLTLHTLVTQDGFLFARYLAVRVEGGGARVE
ncbi:MAG TPA: dihydrofolate reductase family protein [Actinocrinis sp.]|nr:dihydrofolate reductase family protein [Actinocrinis sp.]